MKTLHRTLMTIGLAIAFNSTAFAQDVAQDVSPAETQPLEAPTGVPMLGTVQTFTVAGADASMAFAPVMAAPMPMMGFSMSESEDYSFMHDPSVRKDLELVDKQYEEFVELSKAHQKAVQKLMPELIKNDLDPERRKEVHMEMRDLQLKLRESIGEVLLPHQRDRYKQVARQMKMQMVGMGNAMQHGLLAKELEVTKDQKEKLKKIQVDLHEQLRESNLKLRALAKEKALQVLTTKQRSKVEELIGDEFKQNQNDWREDLEKSRRLRGDNQPATTPSASDNG